MELSAIHVPLLDLRTAEGLTAHARAWHHLAERATLPTQHPEFVAALRSTLLADDELALLQVESYGHFDAVLPLARSAGRLGRWRLVGDEEVFEPGDALCRDSVAAHRLASLIAQDKRPLVMSRVPAASAFVPALREAMRGRGLVDVRPATPCPTIAVDDSWAEPETKFNSRRRSDFRRAARKAAEFGTVEYETLTPTPAEFDALFDEAIRVEAASWKREAGTAIACDACKEAFFRAYFKAASENWNCRIDFLRLGGETAAMHLAVELGGAHWLYKIGFDERFKRCSPGTLLMLHALGETARRGLHRFELMGDAESWITDLWTRDAHPCVQIRTYPFSPTGAAALALDGGQWLRRRIGGAKR
jgi:CelD/BcsL family acetyltransferase involved in cellulose biosynthesis